MKTNIKPKLILIKDVTNGGFTGYFNLFPAVVTQGKTKKETIDNLANAFYDIVKSIEIEIYQYYNKRSIK